MSKQINFYATELDRIMIVEIMNSVFGPLLNIPFNKGPLSPFDSLSNGVMFYLVEERRANEIHYRIHEYYDGTTSEVLDCKQSPILEYSLSYKNTEENYYIRGRFYCCSEAKDFEKKVSRFFLLLKKQFWYVKKYKVYVSKSIDIFAAKFESGRIITKDDLS